VICCDDPVLRRLLTTLLGAVAVALLVVSPAHAAAKPPRVPVCPPITVEESAKAATAIFNGTVSEVTKQPRTDGAPGAIYLQTVTVDSVYRGEITTETVQVQTDRNRADCSLGALQVDREYMFFVSGTGQPWIADGTSGTRIQNNKVLTEITELLGQGEPPIEPTPETAVFTPVDTSEPQSFSRAAAPGAALVLVGLLGLVVVRGVSRRTR
jgi:hypothetical protein